MHYKVRNTKLEAETGKTNRNPKTAFATWKGDYWAEQT